jgi:hypothetical protein
VAGSDGVGEPAGTDGLRRQMFTLRREAGGAPFVVVVANQHPSAARSSRVLLEALNFYRCRPAAGAP